MKYKRTCITCKKEFMGEEWMPQCLECYREFKNLKRIQTGHKVYGRGFFVMAHPDVDQKELIEWINKNFGCGGVPVCPSPSYWDPIKVRPNMEVWFVCTNDD